MEAIYTSEIDAALLALREALDADQNECWGGELHGISFENTLVLNNLLEVTASSSSKVVSAAVQPKVPTARLEAAIEEARAIPVKSTEPLLMRFSRW